MAYQHFENNISKYTVGIIFEGCLIQEEIEERCQEQNIKERERAWGQLDREGDKLMTLHTVIL